MEMHLKKNGRHKDKEQSKEKNITIDKEGEK